jgi:hypothetical protein
MSTFYLINTVYTEGGIKFLAGELIDTNVHPAADFTSVGGMLWPSSDPVIAAYAAIAQKFHTQRAINEDACNSIMAGAVASRTLPQAGTATLVAGVATVNTGVTITANSKVFVSLNTPGGATNGADYKVPTASLVVGAPGTGAFTITAVSTTGGATVATDVSTVNWVVFN